MRAMTSQTWIIAIVVAIVAAAVVVMDAQRLTAGNSDKIGGRSPVGWGVLMLLIGWIIILPFYLVCRYRWFGRRARVTTQPRA